MTKPNSMYNIKYSHEPLNNFCSGAFIRSCTNMSDKNGKSDEKYQREISIYNLPPNILLTIFHYLDLKSLCRSSRVCRLWHTYANDVSLWKIVDLRPFEMNLKSVKKIVRRRVSEHTRELYIKGLVTATKMLENLSSPLLEEIKKKAVNLESLCLLNCYLKNVSIKSFPGCITELSLTESLVPLGWFAPLIDKNLLLSLEHLHLTSCTRISSEDISSICQLKTLKTLSLAGCYRIGDDDVRLISSNLINLTKLDLSGCKKITDVSLHHIARHLKGIRSLSLSKCYKITTLGITVLNDGCLGNLDFLDVQECSLDAQRKALELFADNSEMTLRTCDTKLNSEND